MSTDSNGSAPPNALPRPVADAVTDLLLNRRLALIVTDPQLPDNPIVHASPGFQALTGYAAHEILGRNCRFLQGPGTDVAAVERLRAALAQGQAIGVDLTNYRKSGEPFGNRLQIDPILVDGRLRYFVGVQQELPLPGGTADDRRDMTLRDLRHRLYGAMQLVMSLLRLRMMRAEEPAVAEALADALKQLDAAMLVERRLEALRDGGTADAGAALEELAQSLCAGFEGKVAVEVRCADLPLTATRLEPLLLLASEAITNALRHAFPADRGGRIRVALELPAEGGLELLIEDDGVGSPPGVLDGGGLGGMLMRGFARQLGGKLDIESGPGTRLRLRAPLSSESRSPAP